MSFWRYGPRFRTIQVHPKDLLVLPREPRRAVSWLNGFRRGAHGPRDKAPIDHAARWGSRVAACGEGAAAAEGGDRVPRPQIARGDGGPSDGISPGPQGDGLRRGREPHNRIPLGGGQQRAAAGAAADLVRQGVAVIATVGPPAAFAVKATTTTIPQLFIVAEDPVRLGLVASLARPGGNCTGFNLLNSEVVTKRLELLGALVPGARRIAVLVNPADASNTEPTLRDLEATARAMTLQIQVLNADSNREIDAAFEAMARDRPDALFVAALPT